MPEPSRLQKIRFCDVYQCSHLIFLLGFIWGGSAAVDIGRASNWLSAHGAYLCSACL
jgi:hypothetical protein